MKKCLVLLTVFVIVFSQDTADATTIPVRGYHVVEGGYYPQIGLGAGGGGVGGGFGGASGIGLGGAGIGYKTAGIVGGAGGLGYGVGGGAGGLGYGGIGAGGLGYGGGLALKSVAPIGLGVGGAGIGLGGAGIGAGGAGIGLGGAGLIGAGGAGIGLGGAGGAGIGLGGAGGAGLIGAPLLHHGYGGAFVDKNVYSGGKKNLNDLKFEKASGKGGEEFGANNEGFTKGVAAIQDAKGQSGYYNDQAAGKKALEDGKVYYGGQHFNQQGKNGGEINEKTGHKKGHVIKGYKSSHHKDETGKTEEYYDEAHDEGGKVNFKGESGSFGQLGSQSYKGGHENDEFVAGGRKNQGQYNSQHVLDNTKANHGGYGEKKFGGSGSVYGVNNGIDEQSLLGHQESTGFYKHHPHHIPFY